MTKVHRLFKFRCTGCGNPTLGSNGQLWLVLISQGLLGVLCYVGFHVSGILRFFRRRDPVADAGTAMPVMALLFMLFYNAVSMAISFELLGFAGDNRTVRFRLLHIFEVRDAAISRENAWLDVAAIAQQLS